MSTLSIEITEDEMVKLQKAAEKFGISPEKLLRMELDRVIEARRQWDYWRQRAEQGKQISNEEFQSILSKVPDAPPVPGDELPEGWEAKTDKH